jgi:hypothetical protein
MVRVFVLTCVGIVGVALASLAADAPAVTISLGPRDGKAAPIRAGFAHTGGGNIDVQQPAPDTLVVTMTGVAVAGGHPVCHSTAGFDFVLSQDFDVAIADPKLKSAKLSVEARVIGLLRTYKRGQAEIAAACASVLAGAQGKGTGLDQGDTAPALRAASPSPRLLGLAVPPHTAGGNRNVSINDKAGPVAMPVAAGTFTLHQQFGISVTHPPCVLPCKAASAEFAPDPALDPLWISYWEPFHGAIKKDFGFQVVVRVGPN